MASMGLQVTGIALAVLGWLAVMLCCALPMWRVTAFIGSNIVTSQTIWEGLWMNCVVQSTGQMQCKVYDSLLALPQDLQAARALVIISIIVAALGVLLSVVGGKCTNCLEDESAKAKTMIVAGVVFLLAGLLVIVPVSWTAHNIIQDFYNPLVASGQKREMGASLYVGWAASGLLLLGGGCFAATAHPAQTSLTLPSILPPALLLPATTCKVPRLHSVPLCFVLPWTELSTGCDPRRALPRSTGCWGLGTGQRLSQAGRQQPSASLAHSDTFPRPPPASKNRVHPPLDIVEGRK